MFSCSDSSFTPRKTAKPPYSIVGVTFFRIDKSTSQSNSLSIGVNTFFQFLPESGNGKDVDKLEIGVDPLLLTRLHN